MLLAVDIGNTQTAVGLFSGKELRARWALASRSTDTADEVHLKLSGLLRGEPAGGARSAGDSGGSGDAFTSIDAAVIASVVPPLTGSWRQAAQSICGTRPVVVGPGVKTGLPMRYDNPAEVGADRVADALGAIALVGAPVVVVDLGTATNIEVVDRNGAFLGGVIAPGLGTSAADLAAHAARLPQVDLSFPGHVVGTNTNDAMRSGLMYGELARIDGLVRRIFDELGYEAPVIATGGFANVMAQLSQTVTRHEPDLTLQGLRIIHERNATRR